LSVTLSPEAVADWIAAVGHVREQNPAAAARLHDRIHSTIMKLAHREFEGAEQTLRRGAVRVRSWPVPPYRIYYQRTGVELVVLRLYHGARKPIVR